MHRTRSFVSAFAVTACTLAVACSSGGDDASPDDLGGGGSSDNGGSGGSSAGTAGRGGKGGASGHAGTGGSTGGIAGAAGHGGTPTGTGGHAGTGGAAGGHAGAPGGNGGSAGGEGGMSGNAGNGGTAGAGVGGAAGKGGAAGTGGTAGAGTGGAAGASGSAGTGVGGAAGAGTGGSAGTGAGGTAGAGAGGSAGTGGAAGSGAGGGSFMPPTTCDDAHGFVGCCSPDRATLFYYKAATSTIVSKACTAGKVCGWDATKLDYGCVAPPGTEDPSAANPIECGGSGAGNALCSGAGGAGGAAGSSSTGGSAGVGGAAGTTGGSGGTAGGAGTNGGSAGTGGSAGAGGTAGAGGASAGAGGGGAGGAAGTGGAADVHVVSIDPADTDTGVPVDTAITISFNVKMASATLTTQMAAGTCAGNVQISCDNFATCLATDAPSLDASGAVLTVQPTLPLSHATTCKVKVTTGVTDTNGNPLNAEADMATGFTTAAAAGGCLTGPSVVIDQIYTGGGNSLATYNQKFVELFNRSGAPVDVGTWSLQYESQAGASWTTIPLAGTIPAGGHLLVGLFTSGTTGMALPVTPDTTSPVVTSGTSARFALVSDVTALTVACPAVGGKVIDFVPYGTPNACMPVTVNSGGNANSIQRNGGGCIVSPTDNPSTDFTAAAVIAPRHLASPASALCTVCQ